MTKAEYEQAKREWAGREFRHHVDAADYAEGVKRAVQAVGVSFGKRKPEAR